MKVTLIHPKWKNRGLSCISMFRIPPLGLLQLASLTSEEWEVKIIDENNEEIDFNIPTNLVGLTGMTALAPRAYEIATEYRKRGIPVIMGGIHASVMPDEASRYVDSVVLGEAENIWTDILRDFERGRLRKQYNAPLPISLDFDTKRNISRTFPLYPSKSLSLHIKVAYIQLQRGCPVGCRFCSVTVFNGKRIRSKTIPYVLGEIKQELDNGCQYFAFADDNLVADRRFALAFFEAIKPFSIQWASQADIRIAREEVLKPAVASGLRMVFVGLESISKSSLKSSVSESKNNWRNEYEEAIKRLHDCGVVVEAGFIFGFDGEDKDTVERTVEWAIKQKIDVAQFAILTPLPGTELFDEMSKSGRIITRDWSQYSATQCVFKSTIWEKEEIERKWRWAYKEFYSFSSVIKRLSAASFLTHRPWPVTVGALFSNLEFRGAQP